MSDPSTLPRRDAKGWFLEAPVWLKPDWSHVHAAGLGAGGFRRKLCARVNCRQIALRASLYCRHHDVNWRRKRLTELRTGKGKPPTPVELARLHRANMKRIWAHAPWWPGQTIWLSPAIEAAFVEDCRRAGLDFAATAPPVLNTLRWVWRRSVLDRADDQSWRCGLGAACKRQAKIGPAPEGYAYQPPLDTPPADVRIKQVHRRATAYELAAQTGPIDRATKAKLRQQKAQERRPSRRKFDQVAFIAEHWPTLAPVFKSLQLQPDAVDLPIGGQLALAWHAVLDERARLGEATYGPARKRWQALLRSLKP
jgi:hypothetical protein